MMKMIYDRKSHQPSGLRWFRFKTLPRILFQLEGFTLPPPLPWAVFWRIAGRRRLFFRSSFWAPFFSPLGTPESLSQVILAQNGSIWASQMGSKTGSGFRPGFLFPLSRFSAFLHTTSSASRIAPAISKPHFPLSSFLLFLLSLWSAFG